ncbi:MAG TPA: hypothetical protein VFB79_19550 [Candidatus Angelobacter sp.]|nr:hypothetical protein [Candidatus Angelobacter sp.]
MKLFCARLLSMFLLATGMATNLAAQDASSANAANTIHRTEEESSSAIRGFSEYETFRGMANSSGTLLKLDSTLGYDFNRNFGVFAGVPLYFANDTTGQTTLHDAGAGDAYFGVEAYAPLGPLNYTSTLTASDPTGSVSKGFSPGKPTIDWNNRFRHRFGRLNPFVAAGVGNTVPDSELVTRDFISLGSVAHFEEGAEFDLTKRVYAGGSAYQIVPFGNQQVFNRFDAVVPRDGNSGKGSGNNGQGSGGNDQNGGPAPNAPPPGNTGQPSASGVGLTRENGFDAWVGFEPTRVLRLELGYSRSATFALNSFSFNIGLNVGKLFRSPAMH